MVEFEHFRQQAGLHTFVLSASGWTEKTNVIGIFVKKRDYATINELTVLSNLETHNAQMIREGKSKEERGVRK